MLHVESKSNGWNGEVLLELCDKTMCSEVKGKFCRTVIRSTMLYGSEGWAIKVQHIPSNKTNNAIWKWMFCSSWEYNDLFLHKFTNEDATGKGHGSFLFTNREALTFHKIGERETATEG